MVVNFIALIWYPNKDYHSGTEGTTEVALNETLSNTPIAMMCQQIFLNKILLISYQTYGGMSPFGYLPFIC